MIFQKQDSFRQHMRLTHCHGVYKCVECKVSKRFPKEIVEHITETHPVETAAECPACKLMITIAEDRSALEAHYSTCVNSSLKSRTPKKPVKKGGEKTAPKSHQCDICGKCLPSQNHLKLHKKKHNGEADLHCEYCDFKTIYPVSLKFHTQRHLRDQGLTDKVVCDTCGKEFGDKYDLRTHIARMHERTDDFHCDKCSQKYPSKNSLQRHKNRVHAESDAYVCKVCSARCGDSGELKMHMRTHDAPGFKCRFCGKMIKSKQSWVAHERIHTGENPYK